MSELKISKDTLRAMAELSGLELSDDRLEQLLPQMRRLLEGVAGFDQLDLEGVEPAFVFKPVQE